MARESVSLFASLFIASGLMLSCAPAKQPFLMVQTCLINEKGVADFISEMKDVAVEAKMNFTDNSSNTKRELDTVGYAGRERTGNSPVINIGLQGPDGLVVGAGNLGLPGYQIALGFSEGTKPDEAHAFADKVVRRLEKRWQMSVVPAGSGATPMAGCE